MMTIRHRSRHVIRSRRATPLSRCRRSRGQIAVELLVTAALGTLIGGAVLTGGFKTLHGALAGQRALGLSVDRARTAIELLSQQLVQAGAGLPAEIRSMTIETAEPTRLVFRGNLRGVSTVLSRPALTGSDTLFVRSADEFRAEDSVYLTSDGLWERVTVSAVGDSFLNLAAPLEFNHPAGALVNVVEQVTLEQVDNALVRNDKRLIDDVKTLEFSYDANNPSQVRTITIAVTVSTSDPDPITYEVRDVTISAQVSPPNLNLDLCRKEP